MWRIPAFLVALLVGLPPAAALAQQSGASEGQTRPASAAGQAAPTADLDALGVSFDRVRRALADRAASGDKSSLKLTYYVEVVALAPPIELFLPGELAPGGLIPGGPPTHADIVRHLTRIEFSAPVAQVSSAAIYALQKLAEWEAARVKRYKAEEERRKRDQAERERQKALEATGLVVIKTSK